MGCIFTESFPNTNDFDSSDDSDSQIIPRSYRRLENSRILTKSKNQAETNGGYNILCNIMYYLCLKMPTSPRLALVTKN